MRGAPPLTAEAEVAAEAAAAEDDDDFFLLDFFLEPVPLRGSASEEEKVAAELLQKAQSRHLQNLQWLAAFSGLQKVPQAVNLKSPGIAEVQAVLPCACRGSCASARRRRRRKSRILVEVCGGVRGS